MSYYAHRLVEEATSPSVLPPPAGWTTAIIQSGEEPVSDDRQYFITVWDWDQNGNVVPKAVLRWERIYYWLPDQWFLIQTLRPVLSDGVVVRSDWITTGKFRGGFGSGEKLYLGDDDGQGKVRRLIAE